jgi:hypothetical protein
MRWLMLKRKKRRKGRRESTFDCVRFVQGPCRTHTATAPSIYFPCDSCDYVSDRKGDLKKHSKIHKRDGKDEKEEEEEGECVRDYLT